MGIFKPLTESEFIAAFENALAGAIEGYELSSESFFTADINMALETVKVDPSKENIKAAQTAFDNYDKSFQQEYEAQQAQIAKFLND